MRNAARGYGSDYIPHLEFEYAAKELKKRGLEGEAKAAYERALKEVKQGLSFRELSKGDYKTAIAYATRAGKFDEVTRLREEFKKRRGKERESREGKKSILERILSVIIIVGLIGGVFFLSSNITGYAVGNLTQPNFNIIGIIFLIVALLAGFFYFKKRMSNRIKEQ